MATNTSIVSDRRSFLHTSLAGAGVLAATPAFGWQDEKPDAKPSGLIYHTTDVPNAEPHLDQLVKSWVTPTEHFYIRSHAPSPQLDIESFRFSVEGLVERPLQMTVAEMKTRFASHSVFATLTCAGNRRSEHSLVKQVSGVPWQSGAIGNARWAGPRLSDVLRRAGLKPGAKHVWFEGVDEIQRDSGVIPFGASIPIEKAMTDTIGAPGTILAHSMNDAPLTADHGFPLRTVVPGYIGARSVKWLGKIIVSDRPSDNHYVARAYRLVTESTDEQWNAAAPLYHFVMNSVTCVPAAGASVKPGRIQVRGYALPPGDRGTIQKIEVSTDEGKRWTRAVVHSPKQMYCWQLWTANVAVGADTKQLIVRATDGRGQSQPQTVDWNLKGYMFNAWHQTPLKVEG